MSFTSSFRSARRSAFALGPRAAIALGAALAQFLGAGSVRADTFTAGNASALISAINAANKAGGTHTIVLAAGAGFDLKAANNTTNGANGLPVVGATKPVSLTILGNGATVQRTAGFGYNKRGQPSNPFRLFAVALGASLTLDNVKLKGGWAEGWGAAACGGAVYNQGVLNVRKSSTFYFNIAGNGGVIYNAGGSVTVSDCQFLGGSEQSGKNAVVASNSAQGDGGAVTLGNSSLSGSGARFGGGVYSNGGAVVVSYCTLSFNGARFGGAVYNNGGTLTVCNNSVLSGNDAYHADYPWSGGDGGGIYNAGGAVTISSSTLSGNTADMYFGSGGGLYNASGTVTVQSASAITGNTSSGVGADVNNLAVVYLDATSTIGILDGNPTIPF